MKALLLTFIGAGLLAGAGDLLAVEAAPLDLTGRVTAKNGPPVAGATVLVYSAAPREGTSSLCPYCYADCRKKALTDAEGLFKITALDPTLIFRLLVVTPGCESKLVSKVDPARGDQNITVLPLSEADLKSDLRIKGMVIGEDGQPVPSATINPQGVTMGPGTQWGGTEPYVEPLAVADDQGRFVLFCKSNVVSMVFATAEGRNVAKQWTSLKPGGDYLIRLPAGVTVTGRILREGQPVNGVTVSLTTTDRQSGKDYNGYAATTDAQGNFTILNVPPQREFLGTVAMDSLHGTGAVPGVGCSLLPEGSIPPPGAGHVLLAGELAVPHAFVAFPPPAACWPSRPPSSDSPGVLAGAASPTACRPLPTVVVGLLHVGGLLLVGLAGGSGVGPAE